MLVVLRVFLYLLRLFKLFFCYFCVSFDVFGCRFVFFFNVLLCFSLGCCFLLGVCFFAWGSWCRFFFFLCLVLGLLFDGLV